jgi:hypothetical protein
MKRNWMRGAVKRPGALTRIARKAGMTPLAFAQEHAHDTGPRGSEASRTGEEARFALIAQGKPLPPARKEKTRHGHARLPRAAAG